MSYSANWERDISENIHSNILHSSITNKKILNEVKLKFLNSDFTFNKNHITYNKLIFSNALTISGENNSKWLKLLNLNNKIIEFKDIYVSGLLHITNINTNKIIFTNCRFNSLLIEGEVKTSLHFNDCDIIGLSEIRESKIDKISINESSINKKLIVENTNIKNAIILDNIDNRGNKIEIIQGQIKACSFLNTNFKIFTFSNVGWKRSFWKCRSYIINEKKKYNKNITINDWQKIETEYRNLKLYYSEEGNQKLTYEFHAGEFEARRRQKPLLFRLLSWENLYKIFSKYGLSWWRPLWLALFIGLLVVPYFVSIQNDVFIKNKDLSNNFIQSFWYYLSNMFFIKQTIIKIDEESVNGFIGYIVGIIQRIIVTPLFVLSGLAIRRKFKA